MTGGCDTGSPFGGKHTSPNSCVMMKPFLHIVTDEVHSLERNTVYVCMLVTILSEARIKVPVGALLYFGPLSFASYCLLLILSTTCSGCLTASAKVCTAGRHCLTMAASRLSFFMTLQSHSHLASSLSQPTTPSASSRSRWSKEKLCGA